MEITFCDLRCKEVINTVNGKRLGRVYDLVICCNTCKVLGFVVPGDRKIFMTKEDLFIPWKNIIKIGDDVILVQLFEAPYNNCIGNNNCDNYAVRDGNDK